MSMQCLRGELDDHGMTSMPVLLQRIGAELGSLASQVERLQNGLGPLLLQAARHRPDVVVDLQGIDAINQTLAGLSDFVSALGRCGTGHLVALSSLVAEMPLGDLADRLSGRVPMTPADDFELF